MAEVTARGLVRNTAFAVLAQVWRIGSRFVLTPIILSAIGLEGYGVWTLIFTICIYVSAVDTNFGVAYTKFTAEYDAKGDYDTLAHIVGSGMVLIGGSGLVGLSVIWILRAPILHVLGVPEEMAPAAGEALLLVSAALVMRMSIGCVFQILVGLQRMDLRNKYGILASSVEFAIALVLLQHGWGLLGLAVGHVSGQIVATAAAWWSCHRICPQLQISPLNFTRDGVGKMLGLGGRFQLLAVLMLLAQQGTKLLISGLLGVASLAILEIALKLIALGSAFGGAVVAPLMPAFSNLYATGDRNRQQTLYERGSRIVSAICLPMFAFLGAFAQDLVPLWTGKDLPLAIWTVRLLAPATFINMLTGMGTAALRARGKIRLEFTYVLIGVLLLAALFPVGYLGWGYQGMIVVWVGSGILSSGWFLAAFARRESLDLSRYVRETLLFPLMVVGPVIAAVVALAAIVQWDPLFAGRRFNLLLEVAVWGTVFTGAVGLTTWFGVLKEDDRTALRRMLPGRRSRSPAGGLEGPR